MRLCILASSIPRPDDAPGVSAVDIVEHELIGALRRLDHDVALQVTFNAHRAEGPLTASEVDALRALERTGVTVLDPIPAARPRMSSAAQRVRRLARLAAGRASVVSAYPAWGYRSLVSERLQRIGAEAVLTLWSPEGVAAATGPGGPPVVAYHGDIDHQPGEARVGARELFPDSPPKGAVGKLRAALWRREFRQAHARLMAEVDVIANVTASNATYYRQRGHPRSVYVRNVWRDSARTETPGAQQGEVRIVGHAGRLDATGSTFGLAYLQRAVLPALERALAGRPYRIEIIGSGTISPALRALLAHPRVVARGYVEDLEEELRTASAYMLLNNTGPYRAAYTRHLVAWAAGACLVVHDNSREAIPEISPMENAIVGSDPAEIARGVAAVVSNPELAARVREGGRATYERWFTPSRIAADLDREIRAAVERRARDVRPAIS